MRKMIIENIGKFNSQSATFGNAKIGNVFLTFLIAELKSRTYYKRYQLEDKKSNDRLTQSTELTEEQ